MACDRRCDFNGDGVVDESDREIISLAFGSYPGDANWNPICDLSGDGVINSRDTNIFEQSFGCTFSTERIISVNLPVGATLKVDGVEIL